MHTKQQITEFLQQHFPATQQDFHIAEIYAQGISVLCTIEPEHLRHGGSVSGPTMMMLADVAVYMAILAHVGLEIDIFTSSLNVHFLARAMVQTHLRAEVALLKVGRRLIVAEVQLYSDLTADPVAHATVSYSRV